MSAKQAGCAMREAGRVPGSRPSLLLAIEEQGFREFLAGLLASEGFAVRQAANGVEAVAEFDVRTPDLLITDIVMERMDGFELISRVRQRHPQVPIIAVSGTGRVEAEIYLRMAQQLGADRTLEKPFGIGELFEAISQVLRQRRASGEAGIDPAPR